MQRINERSFWTFGLWTLMLFLVAAVAYNGVPASSQGTSGSLTGQVVDATGAVVPGATVTLTNLGTNYVQEQKTDGTGLYLIKPVEPGDYSLAISAAGFQKYVQSGIVVARNEYATQNVSLKVGATDQTVSVTADTELVNTTSPELSMTINQQSA